MANTYEQNLGNGEASASPISKVKDTLKKATATALTVPVAGITQAVDLAQNIGDKVEKWSDEGVLGKVKTIGANTSLSFAKAFENSFDGVVSGLLTSWASQDSYSNPFLAANPEVKQKAMQTAKGVLDNDVIKLDAINNATYDWGKGWKLANDVAGGIGNSTAYAATGALFSTINPALGATAAKGMIFTSAMGGAINDSYKETGELTEKQIAYGGLSGAIELGTEMLSMGLDAGSGRLINAAINKGVMKEGTTIGAKAVAKGLTKDFVSEAFEEGLSTFLDPLAKKATYDNNAEMASVKDIGYSALVGGLSGALMGGVTSTVNTSLQIRNGSKIVEDGRAEQVFATSETIAEIINGTDNEYIGDITRIYHELADSLVATNGEIATLSQKAKLGQLSQLNTLAMIQPTVELGAYQVIQNPDAMAEAYSKYFGENITAKELTKGIDFTSEETIQTSMREAVKTNQTLNKVALIQGMETSNLIENAKYDIDTNIDNALNDIVRGLNFDEMSAEEKTALLERLGADTDGNIDESVLKESLLRMFEDGTFDEVSTMADAVDVINNRYDTIKPFTKDITENGVYKTTKPTGEVYIVKNDKGYRIADPSINYLSESMATMEELNSALDSIYSLEGMQYIKDKQSRIASERTDLDFFSEEGTQKANEIEHTLNESKASKDLDKATNEVKSKNDAEANKAQKEKAKKGEGKVYSKAETERFIKSLNTDYLYENGILESSLKGKSKNEAVEYLFNRLNSNLSPEEIKTTADTLATFIVNNSFQTLLNEDNTIADNLTVEQKNVQIKRVSKQIQKMFAEGGRNTKYKTMVDLYAALERLVNTIEYENKNLVKLVRESNTVLKMINDIKNEKKKAALPASVLPQHTFDTIDKAFQKMVRNGNMSERGIREGFKVVEQWFSDKNPIIMDVFGATEDENGVKHAKIHGEILASLETLKTECYEHTIDAEGDPIFTIDAETGSYINSKNHITMSGYKALKNILKSIRKMKTDYIQVTIDGKKEVMTDLVQNEVEILLNTPDNVLDFAGNGFWTHITDPSSLFNILESGNKNGVITRMFKELKTSELKAKCDYIQINLELRDFIKNNKDYYEKLKYGRRDFKGTKITGLQYLGLYETSKREQAKLGLIENGAVFSSDQKKPVKLEGKKTNLVYDDKGKLIDFDVEITEQFDISAKDTEYLNIVEGILEKAKAMKVATDIEMVGFTNAVEGFYYPIVRDNRSIASNVTKVSSSVSAVMDWSNKSFNQNVKQGAKNALFIMDIDKVVDSHSLQMCQYADMSISLKDFDRLYNFNISKDQSNPVAIRNLIIDKWDSTKNGKKDNQSRRVSQYIADLLLDMQDARPSVSDATDFNIMKAIRSNASVVTLGANAAVALAQFASYPTVIPYFGTKISLEALSKKPNYKEMDKWSMYAYVRNYSNEAVMAESNLDTIGRIDVSGANVVVGKVLNASQKVSDVLYKPINLMDRFTIERIWQCAKLQAENEGYKVGSDDYFKRAAEIHEEACRATQPNYSASERSGMQRSKSEVAKAFTMFTSAPMKMLSRVFENGMLLRTAIIKNNKSDISKYGKRLAATLGANFVSAVMLIGIKDAVNTFLKRRKKDDDESYFKDFLGRVMISYIGVIPVVNQIVNRFESGYDITDFGLSALNDLLDRIENLDKLRRNIGTLDTNEVVKASEDLIDSIAFFLKIPTKNLRNLSQGLLDRFVPTVGYKVSTFRTAHNFGTDLMSALQSGDESLASEIVRRAGASRFGTETSKASADVITDLYEKNYKVLPKAVSKKVSYTDEEGNKQSIKLTSKQYKAFKQTYGKASSVVDTMVTSKAFLSLSDEAKAKAIKGVYDGYYAMALDEVTGQGVSNKYGYLASIGLTDAKYSVALAGINTQNSVKGADGRTVSGSKKANTIKYLNTVNLTDGERLFLLTYSGYSLTEGDYKGMSKAWQSAKLYKYITTLNVDNATKLDLAVSCGLEVKNGKIVVPSGVVKKFKTVV